MPSCRNIDASVARRTDDLSEVDGPRPVLRQYAVLLQESIDGQPNLPNARRRRGEQPFAMCLTCCNASMGWAIFVVEKIKYLDGATRLRIIRRLQVKHVVVSIQSMTMHIHDEHMEVLTRDDAIGMYTRFPTA